MQHEFDHVLAYPSSKVKCFLILKEHIHRISVYVKIHTKKSWNIFSNISHSLWFWYLSVCLLKMKCFSSQRVWEEDSMSSFSQLNHWGQGQSILGAGGRDWHFSVGVSRCFRLYCSFCVGNSVRVNVKLAFDSKSPI